MKCPLDEMSADEVSGDEVSGNEVSGDGMSVHEKILMIDKSIGFRSVKEGSNNSCLLYTSDAADE